MTLQRRLIDFGDVAQQRIGEIASKNRADLRHLTRRPEPIEARGERLLQGWRDGLNAALLAALQEAGASPPRRTAARRRCAR